MSHPAFTPQPYRASPHFGRHSFPVPHRVGGRVSLGGWLYKAPSTPATMSKQQATLSKQRSTLSKQHSPLLPQTATMSNDSIVKFRPFDNVECCFDIVAVFGNNVTGFGHNVERNFVLSTCSICFDFVERTKFRSTMLLRHFC